MKSIFIEKDFFCKCSNPNFLTRNLYIKFHVQSNIRSYIRIVLYTKTMQKPIMYCLLYTEGLNKLLFSYKLPICYYLQMKQRQERARKILLTDIARYWLSCESSLCPLGGTFVETFADPDELVTGRETILKFE